MDSTVTSVGLCEQAPGLPTGLAGVRWGEEEEKAKHCFRSVLGDAPM